MLYGAQHLSSFADVLVLSFFVSPAEIAIYFAATRIIQVVNLIPYAATVGTAHVFSASHTRGDHDELQRLCRHVAVDHASSSRRSRSGHHGRQPASGCSACSATASRPATCRSSSSPLGVLARVAAGPAEDMLNMTGHGGVSASTYLVVVVVNVLLASRWSSRSA